jgi:hypothetical protein
MRNNGNTPRNHAGARRVSSMRRSVLISGLLLAFAVAVQGCGGGQKQSNTADSAKKDQTAMEELQAIPADVNGDVDALMKPIDDVQAVVDEITSLPSRLNISAKDMMAMAQGTLSNGTVDVKVNGDLTDDARAQITASLKKLKGVVDGLKSTPDKVVALGKKLVVVTAKVPVLATRVTAEAQVAIANPFAGADAKAKAQADVANVQKVQAEINTKVNEAQAKVTSIPALATGALAKLTASFAGSGGDSTGTAKAKTGKAAK